jgi:hypothetical protein
VEVYEKFEIFHVSIPFADWQIFSPDPLGVFARERLRPMLHELWLGFRF